MAEFGISLAEKLVEVLASEAIKVVCEMWNYKKELEDLKETVSTIHSVLLDADAKRDLTHQQQNYIKKLKDGVYDADDLFDEFLTLADELKELGPLRNRRKFYEKVRRFFSSSKNEVAVAYRMSRDVKEIKERLGHIADNHHRFGFIDYKPIIRRREETCSYIDANDIIGRDEDKEAIVDMLLNNPNKNKHDFCAVTIVGVGGLGKTALAKLVYNDERIKNEFGDDFRFWVCVSDQNGEPFDVRTILSKILELVLKQKVDASTSLELVQNQLTDKIRGQKYFLVLDDVWTEKLLKWGQLKALLLKLGQGGSRVLVTTRSKMTGTIIDEKNVHELQGLSPDASWRLFEMTAFQEKDKPKNYREFVKIGTKIVKKCYYIPLAIKVVGSLLYGQDISKWESLEHSGLTNINNFDNEILSILKLSYLNLTPSLKNCFIYCALFPKDCRIKKQTLIDLWLAQQYIISLDGNEDVEDAAEGHFLILLERCFFQDVKKDEHGNIESVKIHDLMHDLAQEVGRAEICEVTHKTKKVGDKVLHLRYVRDDNLGSLCISDKIRSFICKSTYVVMNDRQIESWKRLRVLDVSNMGLKKLPESIEKLLHLRYLDLSNNRSLEVLPSVISGLHNLQTLVLYGCVRLRELPADFSKLVKLRHLDLRVCSKLTCMPWGMDKLTSLKVLPYVFVGRHGGTTSDGLKALKGLSGIRGEMRIEIGENYRQAEGINKRGGEVGGYLKSMKHLTKLHIQFQYCDNPEDVLENLEPPSEVKHLRISGYKGRRIPKWGRAVDNWGSFLSRLVNINLDGVNLEEIPVLSKLPDLKSLVLKNLGNLKYMEEMKVKMESDTDIIFFPSLVHLEMERLKKLKGWWKEKSSGVVDDHHSYYSRLAFPCLSKLKIWGCHELMSFPLCPEIEELDLVDNNATLQLRANTSGDVDNNTAGNSKGYAKLQLTTDNMGYLNSLPINRLTNLKVSYKCKKVGEVESHVLEVLASSLQTLQIGRMDNLRRLCGPTGLQHFTALEHLSLHNILSVSFSEDEGLPFFDVEDEGLPFFDVEDEDPLSFSGCSISRREMLEAYCFPPNLRSLEFESVQTDLPQGIRCLTSLQNLKLSNCECLFTLPEWISCLSSLKSLDLRGCKDLKSLPEAMQKLTSLQTLHIVLCPKLKERCKEPDGEDRPKIQHIPNIYID